MHFYKTLFKANLKVITEETLYTNFGREYHRHGAATEKALPFVSAHLVLLRQIHETMHITDKWC